MLHCDCYSFNPFTSSSHSSSSNTVIIAIQLVICVLSRGWSEESWDPKGKNWLNGRMNWQVAEQEQKGHINRAWCESEIFQCKSRLWYLSLAHQIWCWITTTYFNAGAWSLIITCWTAMSHSFFLFRLISGVFSVIALDRSRTIELRFASAERGSSLSFFCFRLLIRAVLHQRPVSRAIENF